MPNELNLGNGALARRVLAESNEQLVYNVLKANKDGKYTIPEIATQIPGITERTVRRCVADLKAKGFVRMYGKKANAALFGLSDISMYEDSEGMEEIPIVPFGGNMLKVVEFLEQMVSPEVNPLNVNPKKNLLRPDVSNGIRRAIAGVILTTGATGQDAILDSMRRELQGVEEELRYVLRIVSDFNNSSVWYEQYRDRIAFQLRRAVQSNPELFKLAMDFVRSE